MRRRNDDAATTAQRRGATTARRRGAMTRCDGRTTMMGRREDGTRQRDSTQRDAIDDARCANNVPRPRTERDKGNIFYEYFGIIEEKIVAIQKLNQPCPAFLAFLTLFFNFVLLV